MMMMMNAYGAIQQHMNGEGMSTIRFRSTSGGGFGERTTQI
jgi:hypothetical protein